MSGDCLESMAESIRDLQKAKSDLEKRLEESRQKRLCAEDTHSVWQLRLSQSAQERARSLQRLQLAQNELGQSHAKLNTLRKLFDGKNESVKGLQKQIKEERARQKKAATDQENALESIGQSLKDLQSQYSPDQLKLQTQEMDETIKHLKIQTSSEKCRAKALQQKLDEVTTGNAGEKEDGGAEGWSDLETVRNDQQVIQSMMYEDQVKVKEQISNIDQQMQGLEMEADQMDA